MVAKKRAKKKRTKTLEVQVKAVAIDSNYEPVTAAACKYRDVHVYPYLEGKGLEVKKLQGNLARRVYTAPAVSAPGVDYITGVGHGLEDLYTGHYGETIFRIGGYDRHEVNPKIVHFLSCQTAARLGPDFVTNGCSAYFGYDVNFSFTWTEANVFFECDSEIDRAFADGLTARGVHERVVRLFNRRIDELRQAGKVYPASVLETNLDHLRSPMDVIGGTSPWGDPAALLQ